MAEKKKAGKTKQQKEKVGRAPSLNERITDFSTGGFTGKPIWTPKKKNGK